MKDLLQFAKDNFITPLSRFRGAPYWVSVLPLEHHFVPGEHPDSQRRQKLGGEHHVLQDKWTREVFASIYVVRYGRDERMGETGVSVYVSPPSEGHVATELTNSGHSVGGGIGLEQAYRSLWNRIMPKGLRWAWQAVHVLVVGFDLLKVAAVMVFSFALAYRLLDGWLW